MKRPKTYRFSELWDERQEERATAEQWSSTVRRRRGRPAGKKQLEKEQAMLRRLRRRLAAGESYAALAEELGVPEELVREWAELE